MYTSALCQWSATLWTHTVFSHYDLHDRSFCPTFLLKNLCLKSNLWLEHICFFKKSLFFIGVELMYNVVLVSGLQQSDSYVCVYLCVCVYVCESKSVGCSVVTPRTVACFSVHGNLQARILDWVTIPNPGIKSRSPALQADSLQSEPPGRPICICIWWC